jgi:hypothetical protein
MSAFMQIAAVVLSIAVAAANAPAKPAPPAPAKSPAPLSKYERAHDTTMKTSAPADEYFGQMKISFLGIDNTLRDAEKTAGDHTTDPAIISKVDFAEDALKDWERKYPHDPQLARSYFFAIAAEKKIWLQANQQEAWTYMNRIAQVFPNTYFGKLVKRELAIGFTEHYYSEPVPCRTPSPTPSPTPTLVPVPTPSATVPPRSSRRRPAATPTPTPAPTPTPTPSPTPEPTPSPTPEPTQLAKGLKVQVLTPPCVAPPTPTPLPTETPTDTPGPAIVSPQPAMSSPQPVPASAQPVTASPTPASASPAPSGSPRPAP